MPRILVTGFEPFAGSLVNPSQRVVERLPQMELPGIELKTLVLSVNHRTAPRKLRAAISNMAPEAVVCLGQASRAVISLERVAINLLDFSIPDNSGHQPQDEPVIADGPAAYFSTLPLRRMLAAMTEVGVPAELSLSAGSYLCNQSFYVARHHLEMSGWGRVPCGFIHVPKLPEQVRLDPMHPPAPSMSLETTLLGVAAALLAL